MLGQDGVFDRPEKVEWTPSARTVPSIRDNPAVVYPALAISRPAAPTSMMPISTVLTMRMMRALSWLSANCPDSADRKTNGRMAAPVAAQLK